MLYLISTPIGNLKDITFRAVETLSLCDYILCEDTRRSSILLSHYKIKKRLLSFHKFNEKGQSEKILSDLKNGLSLAVISDGGTPGLCDPGADLVRECQRLGLAFTAIPGPCAPIVALTLKGYKEESFQFLGFFPRKDSERKKSLFQIATYPGESVFFESPQRIEETLTLIAKIFPDAKIFIAREITKLHEEVIQGRPDEVLLHFQKKPPRGEFVVIMERQSTQSHLETLPPEELLPMLQDKYGLSLAEAIKATASLLDLPKQKIYKLAHDKS